MSAQDTPVRGLLCDVHGVLYIHPRALPGSVDAVARLRDAGFPLVFLTNSTQLGKRRILEDLRAAGFALDDDDLLTAAEAAGAVLRDRGVRRVGWLCVPELAEDLPGLVPVDPTAPDQGPVDAVLVGDMGHAFTYEVLNRAFRWLHEGAPLFALARNRFYQGADGLALDAGPFVALLEDASRTRAHVLGKPAPGLFQAGIARLGRPAREIAMVGDDLEGDLHPAMDLGLRGILVRTGKFREAHYREATRPADHVAQDLGRVVDAVLGLERPGPPP